MVRLHLFGPPTLTDGSRPLAGAAQQRKPLALLALLAGAGERGMTRDRLVGLLWPELDEAHARGALKQTLYSLRDDASKDLVLGTTTLRLNAATCSCDLWEYRDAIAARRWRDAAVLQQRPFLEGFFVSRAWEFTEWVEQERQALAVSLEQARAAAAAEPVPPITEVHSISPIPPSRRGRSHRPAMLTTAALCLVSYHQPGMAREVSLVLRVSAVRVEADTLRATLRLSNPGRATMRLGNTILLWTSDSTGERYHDLDRMLAEGRSTDLPDLKPGATHDVVLHRPLGATGNTARFLRCGRPVHLQLLVLLFDENLRPGTLALRVGTLTMEPDGVMMRSRRFRYLHPDGRVEAEGSTLHSRTSLQALTRRVREDVCRS